MRKTSKIGLGIIFIMIIFIGVTGCRKNDNNMTQLTGNEISNCTPTPYVNEINGSANIAKGGFAAIQDGWIYYKYTDDSKKDGLYKMKADGTSKVKICKGNISEINVVEDRIYYFDYGKGICEIKIDGTEEKKIWPCDDEIHEVNVVENEIYFTTYDYDWDNSSDAWSLCKMNIRKNNKRMLRYDTPTEPNMYIVNGWIYYYMNEDDEWRNIYKMRTDGTEKQLAFKEKVYDFTVAGDWIYFIVKNNEDDQKYKLYKIKTDGTGRQMIAEDINMDGLNVAGDWIYYLVAINEENNIYNLYKIKTDGTGRQMIAEEISAYSGRINVVGDWICYEAFENDGDDYYNVLYRIKTDGTNKEVIESDYYKY